MNVFLHLFPSTLWYLIVKAYQMFLNLDFHELRQAWHLRHSYTNDTFVQIYLTCLPSSSINLKYTFSNSEHHCNTSHYTHGRCCTSRYHWHSDMTNTKKSIIPTTFSYTVVIFVISEFSAVSEDYIFVNTSFRGIKTSYVLRLLASHHQDKSRNTLARFYLNKICNCSTCVCWPYSMRTQQNVSS
jgi:hypothetical protein